MEVSISSVSEIIDKAKGALAVLATSKSPVRVEGFVTYNLSTANSPHLYFSLCQYPQRDVIEGKPVAKLDAVIFATQLRQIRAALAGVGMKLAPELRAVFLGYLDVYKAGGRLQFIVTAVDVERTRTMADESKDLVRRKLKAEGIFDRNRNLKAPLVPLRIALITSRGSAAESDFMTRLNMRDYAFKVRPFYVNTSGQNVAFSIPDAIDSVNSLAEHFDIVVLARGGGDFVDLANFSLEGPTRAVAMCKVPVWAAIGHSTDDVLVNEVAFRVLGNPNDAASQLNDIVGGFLTKLEQLRIVLAQGARKELSISNGNVARLKSALFGFSKSSLSKYESELSRLDGSLALRVEHRLSTLRTVVEARRERLVDAAQDRLFQSRQSLQSRRLLYEGLAIADIIQLHLQQIAKLREQLVVSAGYVLEKANVDVTSALDVVNAYDPSNVLKRGYALVHKDGLLILDDTEIDVGDAVEIELFSKTALATIDKVEYVHDGKDYV
ncbi:MAG: exodeoxyribonuclease VII large subunit [Actinomycetota bacterium]|nr:exodeoxyribonuclease VII large subunit [Actinomycetota bacterium]